VEKKSSVSTLPFEKLERVTCRVVQIWTRHWNSEASSVMTRKAGSAAAALASANDSLSARAMVAGARVLPGALGVVEGYCAIGWDDDEHYGRLADLVRTAR
jgi:hypothetical protein